MKIKLIALLVSLSLPVFAEDIYIAQSSAGLDTGANAANAHSVAWFNSGANWGASAGQINAGDIVHLCGTISTALDCQGAGSDGNTITILFETNAKMSAAAFSSYGAIKLNSYHYFTIDGGSNGIIENTDNGTSLGNQIVSGGINAGHSTGTTVKNLHIQNIYVHLPGADATDLDGDFAIFFSNAENITISNCVVHDVHWALTTQYSSITNFTIIDNEVYNTDHGIGFGVGAVTMKDVTIKRNHFHDYYNWDTDSNRYHHNAIHIFGSAGALIDNLKITQNKFSGDLGVNNTSHVYLEAEYAGAVFTNYLIANNLFLKSTTNRACLGMIVVGGGGEVYGHIANNTIYGANISSFNAITLSRGHSVLLNNVISGAWQCVSFYAPSTNAIIDYNTYVDVGDNGIGGDYSTIATWSSYLAGYLVAGYGDTHSILTNNAMNGSDGIVLTNSPLIGIGTNLTSEFTIDYAGITRPASAAWDIGAYQFGSDTNDPVSTNSFSLYPVIIM